jgi:Protein kinase domain
MKTLPVYSTDNGVYYRTDDSSRAILKLGSKAYNQLDPAEFSQLEESLIVSGQLQAEELATLLPGRYDDSPRWAEYVASLTNFGRCKIDSGVKGARTYEHHLYPPASGLLYAFSPIRSLYCADTMVNTYHHSVLPIPDIADGITSMTLDSKPTRVPERARMMPSAGIKASDHYYAVALMKVKAAAGHDSIDMLKIVHVASMSALAFRDRGVVEDIKIPFVIGNPTQASLFVIHLDTKATVPELKFVCEVDFNIVSQRVVFIARMAILLSRIVTSIFSGEAFNDVHKYFERHKGPRQGEKSCFQHLKRSSPHDESATPTAATEGAVNPGIDSDVHDAEFNGKATDKLPVFKTEDGVYFRRSHPSATTDEIWTGDDLLKIIRDNDLTRKAQELLDGDSLVLDKLNQLLPDLEDYKDWARYVAHLTNFDRPQIPLDVTSERFYEQHVFSPVSAAVYTFCHNRTLYAADTDVCSTHILWDSTIEEKVKAKKNRSKNRPPLPPKKGTKTGNPPETEPDPQPLQPEGATTPPMLPVVVETGAAIEGTEKPTGLPVGMKADAGSKPNEKPPGMPIVMRPDAGIKATEEYYLLAMMEIKGSKNYFDVPDVVKSILFTCMSALALRQAGMVSAIVIPFVVGAKQDAMLFVTVLEKQDKDEKEQIPKVMCRAVANLGEKSERGLFVAQWVILLSETTAMMSSDEAQGALGRLSGVKVGKDRGNYLSSSELKTSASQSQLFSSESSSGSYVTEQGNESLGRKNAVVEFLSHQSHITGITVRGRYSPYYCRGVCRGALVFAKVWLEGDKRTNLKSIEREIGLLKLARERNVPCPGVIGSVAPTAIGLSHRRLVMPDMADEEVEQEDLETFAGSLTQAVNAMHDASLLHCDIKRKNVVWDRRTKVASLVDFGHASEEKSAGSYIGTEGYTAPEIVMNRARHSRITDAYSLGITLLKESEKFGQGAGCRVWDVAVKLSREHPGKRMSVIDALRQLRSGETTSVFSRSHGRTESVLAEVY